jgi:hypothetical protein
VSTGASYVNLLTRVPTIAETVSIVVIFVAVPESVVMQLTEVNVDHAAVVHIESPSIAVGVVFSIAKLEPSIVMYPPTVVGVLTFLVWLMIGESKEKVLSLVPTIAAIVTATVLLPEAPPSCLQYKAVDETHEVVRHRERPIATVGEIPSTPLKFRPCTVIEVPSDVAMLYCIP